MGSATANNLGDAVRVPSTAPAGVNVYFQAAVIGASPEKSVVVLETSQP